MGEIFDIYNIIFLVLAVVILLRLRSVLGRRTGNERPPVDPFARRQSGPAPGQSPNQAPANDAAPAPRDGVVTQFPTARQPEAPEISGREAGEKVARLAPEGTPLRAGLEAILAADPAFDPDRFVTGAKMAYEMIVTAFAAGDRKALKPLLSREVFDGFAGVIADRESRGEKVEQTFVGIGKAGIVDAALKDGTAHVTVLFNSQLISVTRAKDDTIVAGDPASVNDIADRWTFARDVSQRDPNWKLVATESLE